MSLTKINNRAISGTLNVSQTGVPVYTPTNTAFRQCTHIGDFLTYWKFSGNAGARSAAPTTVAADPVFSNFNYNTNGWHYANITKAFVDAFTSADNFYWYMSRLVYLKAGTITFNGYRDDDHVWYIVPESGSPTFVGGDITDVDGSNAANFTHTFTVPSSGFYRWVGRAIDGSGGANLQIFDVTAGLDLIYVPMNEFPANTVIDYASQQRTDTVISTSTAGVAVLSADITQKTLTSLYKINAVVSGQGGDDTRTIFEYSLDGGSSWTALSHMGDHSWTHRSNNGALSAGYNYEFMPVKPAGQEMKFRAVIQAENNNNGGFFLNSGIDPQPTGHNKDPSTSTLQVSEIL